MGFSLIPPEYLRDHTPSRARGISRYEELRLRKDSCEFLSKCGEDLKMGQLAIATGSFYFHIFFTKFDFLAKENKRGQNRYEVAATCLFLAGKAEEKPRRVSEIIQQFYETLFKRQKVAAVPRKDSKDFDKMRRTIENLEGLLLDVLEYRMAVKHPYSTMTNFLKKINDEYVDKSSKLWDSQDKLWVKAALTKSAWYFLNDSLRCTARLHYLPEDIAVAAIMKALRQHDITVRKCGERHAKDVAAAEARGEGPLAVRPWHEDLFGKDLQSLDVMEIATIPEQGPSAATHSTQPRPLKASVGSRPSTPLTSIPLDRNRNGHPSTVPTQPRGAVNLVHSAVQVPLGKRPREAGVSESSQRSQKLHKSASEPVMRGRASSEPKQPLRPGPPSRSGTNGSAVVLPPVVREEKVELQEGRIDEPRIIGSSGIIIGANIDRTPLDSLAEGSSELPDSASLGNASSNGNERRDPEALSIHVPETLKQEPLPLIGVSSAGYGSEEHGSGKGKGSHALSSGRCSHSPPSIDTPSPLTPRLSPKLAF